MFLRRLTIENVRCIESLELDFASTRSTDENRKWTLILGQNGTGKSSILRAAALLTAGSTAMAELIGDQPDRWVRSGCKHAIIGADLETAEGEKRHIELVIEKGDEVRSIFTRNAETMDKIDSALAHSNRNYFVVGFGASRRLSSQRSISNSSFASHPRAQSVATLFFADAVLNPLESWAMDQDYRRGPDGLDLIRETLGTLLPGVTMHSIDKERKELLFNTPDGVLPLSQLSDGYQNMAAWCGDLLYRLTSVFEERRNPLESRGLLLVDELDLHLHPVWQRNLRDFLDEKLPNFQILATTHSPLTAQQSGKGELYFMERTSLMSPPVLKQFGATPNLMMAHQILADPAFGIETLNSKKIEALHGEHESLNLKKKRSAKDDKRLLEVMNQLESVPSYSKGASLEDDDIKLMRQLRSAMKK